MKLYLAVTESSGSTRKVDLPSRGSLTFGRGSAADVQIDDGEMSRKHCRIDRGPYELTLVDLDSSNGTFLNGQEITEPVTLEVGDTIEIGNSILQIAKVSRREAAPKKKVEGPDLVCLSCGRIKPGRCRKCGAQYITDLEGIPNFRIMGRIGGGGMGVVLLARQLKESRLVALKVLAFVGEPPEGVLERFIREAKIPDRLKHESIIQVYGSSGLRIKPPQGLLRAGEKPGKAGFIVLEFVKGKDLFDIVEDGEPLEIEKAVRVGIRVAEALAVASKEGIVHRDIKPHNIMLTEDDRVKVMDFGLAKSFETAGLSGITAAGKAIGTPAFMSPEQIEDACFADHLADIYSLGATLFYIVTGIVPFEGEKTREILTKVIHEPPPRAETFRKDIPRPLSDIIVQCMEKDPKQRYPSATHLLRDLEKVRKNL
ncbi:MAG: protein kinase domain-containing protein [Planctomycetota bacterium]|jgi:serine/threonine protein kinase